MEKERVKECPFCQSFITTKEVEGVRICPECYKKAVKEKVKETGE